MNNDIPRAASTAATVPPTLPEGEALEPKALHWPRDIKVVWQGGIFFILFFTALYFSSEIVIPIVFAFVLNLLLQPPMRALLRLHVPKSLAALLMLIAFFSCLAALILTLSAPAAGWVAKAPEALPQLEQRLSIFKKPIAMMQHVVDELQRITEPSSAGLPVSVKGPGVGSLLFGSTHIVASFGTTILLLFYLLMAGDLFLRRLVEVLPTLKDKKQVVAISHEIEQNISLYLVTITVINMAVGVATGVATYLCGLPDPILWGAAAFLLNYIVILGPLTGVATLIIVGFLTFDSPLRAILPAAIYFTIHIIEGETITPMLLARRFTLNPVLVIISLVFWFWMWGVAGAFLAVPLLAILKIICERIEPLTPIAHFIGGEAPPS
jgi:predicted PurR-regulated permease PerM